MYCSVSCSCMTVKRCWARKALKKVQQTAIYAAQEFEALRPHKGVVLGSLDDWFVGWAKFVIVSTAQFSEESKQTECVALKTELCGAEYTACNWSPASFRTYVNSIAAAFKASGGGSFVPSGLGQFPFNRFMNGCVTRYALTRVRPLGRY